MPAEAAPSWLWVPELGPAGTRLDWSESDLHYLTRVCRLRGGERVTATDGRGGVASVLLEGEGAELSGRIESVEQRQRDREAWVLCGAPEGDRGDWMIEKLAELGVAAFVPVQFRRGAWDESGKRQGRWSRLTLAALRQSQSPFRMEVRDPAPLEVVIRSLPLGGSRWLADPAGPRGRMASGAASPGVGVVGPSAGFEEAEWSLLRAAGFDPIALSVSRLRTETAAIAWACWWASG